MATKRSGLAGNASIQFRGGREMPTHNDYQKLMLAILAMDTLSREWLLTATFPPPDRYMTMLILAVYSCDLAGKPLNKKAAWRQTGLDDIKTARRYIAEAQEERWIKVIQSPEDRRRELLIPTEKLRWHVVNELDHFGHEVRTLINAFLQFPLPKTRADAPTLPRTKRDSSPDRIIEEHLKYVDRRASEPFEERERERKNAFKMGKQLFAK